MKTNEFNSTSRSTKVICLLYINLDLFRKHKVKQTVIFQEKNKNRIINGVTSQENTINESAKLSKILIYRSLNSINRTKLIGFPDQVKIKSYIKCQPLILSRSHCNYPFVLST